MGFPSSVWLGLSLAVFYSFDSVAGLSTLSLDTPQFSLKEAEKNFLALQNHHNNALNGSENDILSVEVEFVDSRALFITEVNLGTPAQTLKMVLDTGSSNCWVVSTRAKDTEMNKFDNGASSTFKSIQSELEYDITFGTGAVTLVFGKDNFEIDNVMIENQDIGLAIHVHGNVFKSNSFHGILGLAFPDLSVPNTVTVFDRLMEKGYKSFAFALNYDKFLIGNVTDEESQQYYEGEIVWSQVTEPYYWKIDIDAVLIDGKPALTCEGLASEKRKNTCQAIVDSGTSFNSVPGAYFARVLADLKGEEEAGCVYDKNLTYVINGVHYTFTPEDYLRYHPNGDTAACQPKLMQLDVGQPHGPAWLLGELFHLKYYTVYDRENSRVGFAPATNPNDSLLQAGQAILRFNS